MPSPIVINQTLSIINTTIDDLQSESDLERKESAESLLNFGIAMFLMFMFIFVGLAAYKCYQNQQCESCERACIQMCPAKV